MLVFSPFPLYFVHRWFVNGFALVLFSDPKWIALISAELQYKRPSHLWVVVCNLLPQASKYLQSVLVKKKKHFKRRQAIRFLKAFTVCSFTILWTIWSLSHLLVLIFFSELLCSDVLSCRFHYTRPNPLTHLPQHRAPGRMSDRFVPDYSPQLIAVRAGGVIKSRQPRKATANTEN